MNEVENEVEVENEGEVENQVENKAEVENEVEVKLNQTRLNRAVTQLKSNLVPFLIKKILNSGNLKIVK